jgi:2,5-dioxopentanoate dehydrogenase
MKLTGYNLIGNRESANSRNAFFAKNPETQAELAVKFFEATVEEIDDAVKTAQKAFDGFRSKTNEERAVFLETIAACILDLGEALVKQCMDETALPEARITGERMRTVNQLKLFASVVREGSWVDARIDTAIPNRQPVPKPDIRQMQIPLGPVGIFGASNFPLAFSVAGGDTASALAAGCPVIVKAHPLHPGTSELVGRAILLAAQKTNMPEGVFSLVQGASHEAGMAIVNHPGIKAIGFTGSFKGGKALFDAANRRETPIPVFAEMGSVNPVFILPGALKERNEVIAAGLVNSVALGVGQFCTSPGLVVTQKSEDSEKFIQNLKTRSAEIPAGVMLSEQIKRNFLNGLSNLCQTSGVETVFSDSEGETGIRVGTSILSADFETFLKNKNLSEEVFGPSTLNISTQDKSEMIRMAQELEGHLTATIHGTEADLEEYMDLINILEQKVGRIIFNGFPTGVEVCHSMVHGGPYPATTAVQSTSVGTSAIRRFSRPVCYQDFPQKVLPEQLRNDNPLKIWRMINGELTREKI